jgi:PKD repeat protein
LAAQVTLAWDANSESDLGGYNVYTRVGSSPVKDSYDRKITVALADLANPASPQYQVSNVNDSETTFFAVSAHDTSGNESGLSNSVSYDPSPANQGPTANFTINTSSGEVPLAVSFDATGSTDSDGTIGSYSWAFGDGSNGTGSTTDYTYNAAGIYIATLTVTDDDGATDIATTTITVTDSTNQLPESPVPSWPLDGAGGRSLVPRLQTEDFFDSDGDTHALTQWQISTAADFSSPVLDVTSDFHLNALKVPDSILEGSTTYYWRTRFYDDRGGSSDWSEVFSFGTQTISDDANTNGIPDDQEVDATADVDDNGELDIDQMTRDPAFKSIEVPGGSVQIAVEGITNVDAIESLKYVDPTTISDSINKPADMLFGLVSMRLVTTNIGDTVEVAVYFSESTPAEAKCYKYNSIDGWLEYSAHTAMSADGKSVILLLKDGGHGDADIVENGIIVDPVGMAVPVAASSAVGESLSSDSGGAGGCFIATAAFGSYVEPHVRLLRDFRDRYLLTNAAGRSFVEVYYRYGPFAADYIKEHGWLKPFVRMLLMPLVGFSYFLLKASLVTKVLSTLLPLSLILVLIHSRRRLRPV